MSLSATNIAALEAEHSSRIYFISLDLAGDPFYACTGTRSYTFGGTTYLGLGEISGIGDIATAADAAARQITLTMSGVDAYITEPLLSRTNYKGRAAIIYRGLLDAEEELVDTPFVIWTGRMDVASVALDHGSAVARMTCEPSAAMLLRPNVSRYADEDHQLRFPGDKFYEYLPQMEKKDVLWGGVRVYPSTGGRGYNDNNGGTPWSRDKF